jgi:hypothetical protein
MPVEPVGRPLNHEALESVGRRKGTERSDDRDGRGEGMEGMIGYKRREVRG